MLQKLIGTFFPSVYTVNNIIWNRIPIYPTIEKTMSMNEEKE